jgi:hypothetical protein
MSVDTSPSRQLSDMSSSYRLRCTVSGGLESFAEEEISQLLLLLVSGNQGRDDNNNAKVKIDWHFRGHSGSQLDVIFMTSSEFSNNNDDDDSFVKLVATKMCTHLRYIDHVAMLVFSRKLQEELDKDDYDDNNNIIYDSDNKNKNINNNCILRHVSKCCQEVDPTVLEMAIHICRIWYSKNMQTKDESSFVEIGELLPTPALQDNNNVVETSALATSTVERSFDSLAIWI